MEDPGITTGRLDDACPVGGGVVAANQYLVSAQSLRSPTTSLVFRFDGQNRTHGFRRRYATRVGAIAAVLSLGED